MTAKQLRDRLNEIIAEHPEAADIEVFTMGCDCDGDASSVSYNPAKTEPWKSDANVYISRTE